MQLLCSCVYTALALGLKIKDFNSVSSLIGHHYQDQFIEGCATNTTKALPDEEACLLSTISCYIGARE